MPKIKPFEEYSLEYDRWFEENRLIYDSEIKAIKAHLKGKIYSLEIGAGSGRFAEPLGVEVGLEPSVKMAQIAKRRGIKVVNGIAEKLPFGDARFECALMVTTVCFLDDLNSAFREAHRVLKRDGCLIIGFIDKDSPVGMLYRQQKENNPFYKIADFFSVKEVVGYLRSSGFKDFDFTQTIFRNLPDVSEVEPVREGYGEGSFVVIKAGK